MSVTLTGFLGCDLTVPDDRRYDPAEGLWVRETPAGELAVGLTEPAILLAGSIRQVDSLVEDGEEVDAGQTVCLALTGKLRYLASPVAGVLRFSGVGGEVDEDPYGTPLFFVTPRDADRSRLTDAAGYAAALARSEGAHNPTGAKGGGSSTCKSVYWGIGQQKLQG